MTTKSQQNTLAKLHTNKKIFTFRNCNNEFFLSYKEFPLLASSFWVQKKLIELTHCVLLMENI